MIVKRPAILIYTSDAEADILKEVCAGIEEEGVLFEVSSRPATAAEELAFQAAADSVLGSGIGIAGRAIAMQMRLLPEAVPVFVLPVPSADQARTLGSNSARAIKRLPFKEI